MTNDDSHAPPATEDALARQIGEVLNRYRHDALGGASVEATAQAWLDAGFDDPEEVDEWLAARCFTPHHAQALNDSGFTPAQSALLTGEGRENYLDTVAFKFVRGDLTLAEARRIITSDFWNS
ncbi:MAG: hypothetical protein QOD32_2347 [Pyrinomonadaceae bacterium]|jgi:hypothetical protein|nr:hypothetical protein [Pyrinomonadaceae bacterium]